MQVSDSFREAWHEGYVTASGKTVTYLSALRVSAVWACVNIRSASLARTPLITYRRRLGTDGRPSGKDRAYDHYLYPLLRYRANPYMTAFRFKRQMQAWIDLTGNAYAELEINGRGQVTALWPWRPDRTSVQLREGAPWYTYRMDDGREIGRPWHQMLHLRGLETDGLLGLSPIAQHRQTIGASLAMVEHGARFFSNGARPLGVIEHPEHLSDEALANLRQSWLAMHGGLENAYRPAILEEGMKYREVGLKMVDAQYLESMKFTVTDIARIFGVPPHKIGDLDRSTNNNIEHQGLEWYQDGLGPWFANWEEELTNTCLSNREAQTIEIEFLRGDLDLADLKSKGEFLTKTRLAGIISANDARKLLRLNPAGPEADELLQPSGTTLLGGDKDTK